MKIFVAQNHGFQEIKSDNFKGKKVKIVDRYIENLRSLGLTNIDIRNLNQLSEMKNMLLEQKLS
jgi:hypothetical protein